MHRAKRICISDLNQHLTCKICKGYFIDATTIIECLHTFCRSCIVQYLEKNKYCPVCDVQVHKTKPLLNIRPDKTIQDIVYKLVPRLVQNETQRRKEFYDNHPKEKPSAFELLDDDTYHHILAPDESICLKLTYHGCSSMNRYLKCPAAVSVAHLKKLIEAKYDLNEKHRVEILYNQDCLNSSLTLVDISCIYLWKRKSPLELSFRIYECTAKKIKLDADGIATDKNQSNNNNWKEVQLRISENGEMSITGIQDNNMLENKKYKTDGLATIGGSATSTTTTFTVVSSQSSTTPTSSAKKELPALKYIGKSNSNNTTTSSANSKISTSCSQSNKIKEDESKPVVPGLLKLPVDVSVGFSTPASLCSSAAETNTVFSTINTIKCSTKSDEQIQLTSEVTISKEVDRGVKRKTDSESDLTVSKQKQKILNHSIGLLNLSNNHPLKKHSKMNRNVETVSETATTNSTSAKLSTISTSAVTIRPALPVVSAVNSQSSTPSSKTNSIQHEFQLKPPQPGNKYQGMSCYLPKSYNPPIINVPKLTGANTSDNKADKQLVATVSTVTSVMTTNNQASKTNDLKSIEILNNNNKNAIKSKASTPIGYKTLRDPPKSWNSQISKAHINKPVPDPKYSDLKNVRPAKFFKGRNMPRYLGNPASGVKPMYQMHSPEKDKTGEKSEIKKHSIVKIDPKTLKPISEKAPETTSLSNHSDLRINTSSVSIFNPLKIQSSPKNDVGHASQRKSPKSPHSPKLKTSSSGGSGTSSNSSGSGPSGSPSNKRDKINLNFTPPNPFIPNLTSPTVSPNQFLYPTGFPAYDPRIMVAYHNLWYNHGIPFPAAMAGLNLDLNSIKGFDSSVPSPTSPKIAPSQTSHVISQQSSKNINVSIHSPLPSHSSSLSSSSASEKSLHSYQMSKQITTAACSPINISSHSLVNTTASTLNSVTSTKKVSKDANKNEKTIENALEKLSQNRAKEMKNNEEKTKAKTKREPGKTEIVENVNKDNINKESCKKAEEKIEIKIDTEDKTSTKTESKEEKAIVLPDSQVAIADSLKEIKNDVEKEKTIKQDSTNVSDSNMEKENLPNNAKNIEKGDSSNITLEKEDLNPTREIVVERLSSHDKDDKSENDSNAANNSRTNKKEGKNDNTELLKVKEKNIEKYVEKAASKQVSDKDSKEEKESSNETKVDDAKVGDEKKVDKEIEKVVNDEKMYGKLNEGSTSSETSDENETINKNSNNDKLEKSDIKPVDNNNATDSVKKNDKELIKCNSDITENSSTTTLTAVVEKVEASDIKLDNQKVGSKINTDDNEASSNKDSNCSKASEQIVEIGGVQ